MGEPGADGTPGLVALSVATAQQSTSGGAVIHVGPDSDANGTLDIQEIMATGRPRSLLRGLRQRASARTAVSPCWSDSTRAAKACSTPMKSPTR